MKDLIEWRAVPGYPEYLISEYGFVVRKKDSEPKAINKAGRGYLVVRFSDRKTNYIHSLVLEAFVGPRPFGYVACHNDGDIYNNHYTNLRWDTQANNNRDKELHGTNYKLKNKTLDEMFFWVGVGFGVKKVGQSYGTGRHWTYLANNRKNYRVPKFASNDYRTRNCRKISVAP